jgi:hypothetical protein
MLKPVFILGITSVVSFAGCARTGETDAARTSGLSSPSASMPVGETQGSAVDEAAPALDQSASVAVTPAVGVSTSTTPSSNTGSAFSSVAALLANAPKAKDVVTFSARVLKVHACPTCAPGMQCKPCEAWLIVGDNEGAEPADSVVLLGNPVLPQVALHAQHVFTARWSSAPSQSVTLTTSAGVQPLAAELSYVAHAP